MELESKLNDYLNLTTSEKKTLGFIQSFEEGVSILYIKLNLFQSSKTRCERVINRLVKLNLIRYINEYHVIRND